MMLGMRKYVIALLLGLSFLLLIGYLLTEVVTDKEDNVFAVIEEPLNPSDSPREQVAEQCKQLSEETGKQYQYVEGKLSNVRENRIPADCFEAKCTELSYPVVITGVMTDTNVHPDAPRIGFSTSGVPKEDFKVGSYYSFCGEESIPSNLRNSPKFIVNKPETITFIK